MYPIHRVKAEPDFFSDQSFFKSVSLMVWISRFKLLIYTLLKKQP